MPKEDNVDRSINKRVAVIAAMLTAGIVAAALVRPGSVQRNEELFRKAAASVAAGQVPPRSGTLIEYPPLY
jgi:hypothetical protein